MPRKQGIDIMKFWPLLVSLVLITGSWFTLKADAGQQEKRLTKVEEEVEEQSKEYSEINVAQVKLQTKVDSLYELSKDIKETLKELKAK